MIKYLDDEIIKNTKLESCPFCGSDAKISERYHTDVGYSIRVGCPECFCKITKNFGFDFNKSTIQYNIDAMVKKWNTREVIDLSLARRYLIRPVKNYQKH